MSRAIASAFAIHSLSLLLAANAVASTQPGDKPLSAIALSLEQRGLGGITDVEFDNRQWDVDVRNAQGQRAELKVDPMTAEITRCRGRACP